VFQVKWQGYPASEAQYEPVHNLVHGVQVLAVYYKHRFGGPTRENLQIKLEELKEAVDLNNVDTPKLLSEFDLSFQDDFLEAKIPKLEDKVS